MSEVKIQDGLYYNKDHEWVKIEGDNATVGISDHAQNLLTDVVFVELPQKDKEVKQFDQACVVESVKSVSDIYAPLSGKISEVNSELENSPELINKEPYGGGWIFKLSGINEAEKENLMDAAKYKEFIQKDNH